MIRSSARLLLAAASVLALAAYATAQTPAPAAKPAAARSAAKPAASMDPAWPAASVSDPAALGFSKAGLDALDARMTKAVADGDTAGMTYMLIRHGQVADFRSIGKQSDTAQMKNDSLFRIYSMSKPITGVAMMQLYEQGKWKLDDPITKFAPELAGLKELTYDKDGKVITDHDGKPVLATPKRPPTMKELMSHTAGFAYGLSGNDPANEAFRKEGVLASKNLDEMMTKIAGIPLLYEPGTKWSYSAAVDIQGYLVQKLSGQKFGDYLKQHVTGPMGMADTAFYITPDRKARFTEVYHWDKEQNKLVMNPDRPDRPGFTDPNRLESGGGGLTSSTHDYARLMQMFLNKGEIGGHRILKPETVALMHTNMIGNLHVNIDGTAPQKGAEAVGFGLDFAIYTNPTLANLPYGKSTYYWGGAAGTWFWIDPVNDLAFVGMIQNMGPARPGAMNFRAESAKLVYDALTTKAAAAAPARTPAKVQ
jgi:CubicO group peptidase (beta-lactamase class C family)